MSDLIGSSHMTQGSLTSLAFDRFGCLNSSLALNGGWTQISSGIYFNSPDFTISVWVYPKNIGTGARILDFANSMHGDYFVFSFCDGTNLTPQFYIPDSDGSPKIQAISSQNLTLDQWQFLAYSFNGTTSSIYLNGTLTAQTHLNQFYTMPTVPRTNCYIGKSNFGGDGYSYSYLDDLRFFNKCLTQTEIITLLTMNQTQTSKKKIFQFFFVIFVFIFIYFFLRLSIEYKQKYIIVIIVIYNR
jgi:hypothetical protein